MTNEVPDGRIPILRPFSYLPHTDEDRRAMLVRIGAQNVDELFADIPEDVRLNRPLSLPPALPEWDLMRDLRKLADRNTPLDGVISLLGAGAYRHYIPAVVDAVVGRSEFYTSYTPYQPEISQGMLQAIFEYQSLVCALFDMDAANASLYDGATAVGEAALMACAHTGKSRILVSRAVHPEYRAVLATYARGHGIEVDEIALADGLTDTEALARAAGRDVAAVILQQPNFFGGIEDVRAAAELAHGAGALLVAAVNPVTLGVLEAPGRLGVDIAVAEGQPLGGSLSFGGPYLGVMAVREGLIRRLPGRIVGQTVDGDGRRGFVLTLQAREQHIRREKASSNICSNQALCALAASVYLSCMGPAGLAEVARRCFDKAHYAADAFAKAGYPRAHHHSYFHEFAVDLGVHWQKKMETLRARGIFFGVPLADWYPEAAGLTLVAFTETVARDEIDRVAESLGVLE